MIDDYLAHITFGTGGFQEIPCPSCDGGKLKMKSINYGETAYSADRKRFPKGDKVDEIDYFRCAATLECSEDLCGEIVTVVGDGCTDRLMLAVDKENPVPCFFPVYFFPPIHLFKINEHCPKKVREELIKAFGFYYADYSACANKIRNCIELILDNKKIVKEKLNSNGKYSKRTLHDRIEIFAKQNPELGALIMAVKWISNAGSHSGQISKNDALDGLELLEHVIYRLYDKKEGNLIRLAQKISKKKGPLNRDHRL